MREIRTSGLMSGDWKRNYGANCDTGIGESSRKQYSLAAYGHRASRRLYARVFWRGAGSRFMRCNRRVCRWIGARGGPRLM